LKNHNRIAV